MSTAIPWQRGRNPPSPAGHGWWLPALSWLDHVNCLLFGEDKHRLISSSVTNRLGGRDSVCFGSPIFALPTSIALTFQVSFIYTACSYTQQSWSFTAENGNQTDDLKSKILETLSIDVFTRCPCRLPASQSISIHNTCWDMDYWVNTLLIGIAPLGEVPSLWLKSTGTLRLWMYLWWANTTVQHPPPSAHDQSHLEILEEPCKHKNMMLSF